MLSIEGKVEAVSQTVTPLVPQKAERPIQFSDFNFKLAVINELTFGDHAALPPFKLNEFINGYSERKIDISSEGYEPIPEVVQFFEAYEFDEKFASSITSLYLDGGNELYLAIAPLWNGETPEFDIKDFSDIDHFPNLKELTNELFPMTAELEAQLIRRDVTIL